MFPRVNVDSTFGLVGRDDDLERLSNAITRGIRRVSVVGPGGIGKTSLVGGLSFPNRTTLQCRLADARSHDDIVALLGLVLGAVPGSGSRAAVHGRLASALAAIGPSLLALDNVEQILPEVGALLDVLEARAPEAIFVLTSRVDPCFASQALVRLAPLGPGPGGPAAALFRHRAEQSVPGRALDDPSDDTVTQIVRQLDGVPLAIELAAARVPLFGVRGLLERLDRRLDVLGADLDTGRSLRSVHRWSVDLLSDTDRRVLSHLSVFRGEFEHEAATHVAGLSDTDGIEALDRLRAASLVNVRVHDGRALLSLHETTRLYAEELLDASSRASAYERHAEFYLERGLLAARSLRGHDHSVRLRWLRSARANLHAVIDRAAGAAQCVRAHVALHPLVHREGASPALVESFRVALANTPEDAMSASDRAEAWCRLGQQRSTLGDSAAAEDAYRVALTLARQHPARVLEAQIVLDLALSRRLGGSLQEARALFEEALDLATDTRARAVEATVLHNLASLYGELHRWDDAHDCAQRSLAIRESHGYEEGVMLTRTVIGHLLTDQNRPREAIRQLELAHAYFVSEGDRRGEASTQGLLAVAWLEAGELTVARTCAERALASHQFVGRAAFVALSLCVLGDIAWERGEHPSARDYYTAALGMAVEQRDDWGRALYASRLGLAEGTMGNAGASLAAFALAEESLGRVDDRMLARAHALHRAVVAVRSQSANAVESACALLEHEAGPSGTHVLSARRWLRAALASSSRTRTLMLGPHVAWFALSGEPRVDIARRGTLRRIVDALAREHARRPGRALSVDQLLRAAWPGERVLPEAGAGRVYVAIASLRRLGLTQIQTRDRGYLFDPELRVERTRNAAGTERTRRGAAARPTERVRTRARRRG